MIEFLKDKIYYIMGGTILLLVILIIISSCSSSNGDYSSIEENMKNAATNYYKERKKLLPKENGEVIKVSLSTLVEAELIEEIFDPNNTANKCDGYVEVYNSKGEYVYVPFLVCKGNYEPNYLNEKVKADTPDELGDGVYEIDGEFRYRGENVKNYVKFNNSVWRIIKVDSQGDIKIARLFENEDERYAWDTTYNPVRDSETGINTDFQTSNARRILKGYYDSLSKEAKVRLVPKTLCVGAYGPNSNIEKANDCVYQIENQYFVMLTLLDVKYASTNEKCVKVSNVECNNRNYLTQDKINGWLGAVDTETNYNVYSYNYGIFKGRASSEKRVPQVVYLTGKTLTVEGNGSKDTPYILK